MLSLKICTCITTQCAATTTTTTTSDAAASRSLQNATYLKKYRPGLSGKRDNVRPPISCTAQCSIATYQVWLFPISFIRSSCCNSSLDRLDSTVWSIHRRQTNEWFVLYVFQLQGSLVRSRQSSSCCEARSPSQMRFVGIVIVLSILSQQARLCHVSAGPTDQLQGSH
jgi:hypothetical protein